MSTYLELSRRHEFSDFGPSVESCNVAFIHTALDLLGPLSVCDISLNSPRETQHPCILYSIGLILASEHENIMRSLVLRGTNSSTHVKSPVRQPDRRQIPDVTILNSMTLYAGYFLFYPYLRGNVVDEY